MLHTPTHNTHKDVFTVVLIVFQPLLGAVLLHSLCCNTHNTHMDVLCPLLSIVFQPVLSATWQTYIHTSHQAIHEPRHTNRCFTNSMRNADWCFKDPCCWMLANTSVTWRNILRALEIITFSSDDMLWFTAGSLSAPVLLWTSPTLSRFCYLIFATAKRRIAGQHRDTLLEKDRMYSAFDLLFAFRRYRDSNQHTLPWNLRTLQLGCCIVILFFWAFEGGILTSFAKAIDWSDSRRLLLRFSREISEISGNQEFRSFSSASSMGRQKNWKIKKNEDISSKWQKI